MEPANTVTTTYTSSCTTAAKDAASVPRGSRPRPTSLKEAVVTAVRPTSVRKNDVQKLLLYQD